MWIPDNVYAELCTIHVAPAVHRSGVGAALLEAPMFDSVRQGFARLRLNVRADNTARMMYEKTGFVCTGTEANGYLTYERSI